MDINETGWEVSHWIHLAQERDQCRAVVNMVMNLHVRYKAENFLTG
jgi:hypothetical protein